MSKKKRNTDRIWKRSHEHRHDKAYRSAQA